MKKEKDPAIKEQKLVSIARYAELCGITRMGVYQRIKAGTLEVVEGKNQDLVDILIYPPVQIKKGRRPFPSVA